MHFRGPRLEAFDRRAGESSSVTYQREVRATSEARARAIGERMAEKAGEGAVVEDVERTYPAATRRHGNVQREVSGEYHTRTGKVGAVIHRTTSRDGVAYSYIGAWGAGSGLSAADMRRQVESWRANKRGMKTIHPFVA